jgi:FkbM family methyltransferase
LNVIKHAIQSALGKLGYKVIRLNAVPDSVPSSVLKHGWTPLFLLLKRLGFKPQSIIDVGANTGAWTREAVQVFPEAEYTLIEPQDHLKVHVHDLIQRGHKIRWIDVGVGDVNGQFCFTVGDRTDSSSFVPSQQQATVRGQNQVMVDVKTLNDLVSSGTVPMPEMVKVDAEGFDLKVLSGASDLLGKTDVFLVEALVCARDYENTMLEVLQRMHVAGYRIMDITDLNRSPKHGVLWLCELAFLRNGSPLLDKVISYE